MAGGTVGGAVIDIPVLITDFIGTGMNLMTYLATFAQNPESESAGLVVAPAKARALTASEFAGLADVPPEVEWFANLQNPRTRPSFRLFFSMASVA